MRMSKKKTKVLEVSREQPVPRLQITVDGQQLKQITAFRYLGSWLHESGDLDREVQARLQGAGNREHMEECKRNNIRQIDANETEDADV